jgi:hypothetical protein
MNAESAVMWAAFAVMLLGWFLYFHERERSRDYASDLAQLIYDYDLGREDLRRSLEWDEIADRVGREAPDCDRTLQEVGER